MAGTAPLFQDNDAAMQKKLKKLLQAVLKRDQTALNPKKTRAISCRTLILDDPALPDGSTPLSDAASALIAILTANLSVRVPR